VSSSTTVSQGSSPPRTTLSLKSLSVSIHVAHNPISRGSTQTIDVKVSEKGNSSKPVPGAHVDGKVTYASHEHIETFSGITDSNGDMKPSYSWTIGPNSKLGIFRVDVNSDAQGYKSGSGTTTFEVIDATPQNTTNTNTTTPLPMNNTGGGSVNSTSGSDDNNDTNTVFNPLIPSSGGSMENETAPQEQTGVGAGNNATISTYLNNKRDKVQINVRVLNLFIC
jgi:hypothetical protein